MTFAEAFAAALARLQMQADPAEVIKAVYRECPRTLPVRPLLDEHGDPVLGIDGEPLNHEKVYLPVIGRAPKDSVFHTPEVLALLDELPEDVRLLIGQVDVHAGTITITLYDEANDVDRHIGPIDMSRFTGAHEFRDAITTLLTRLPRVLAADWN